MAQTQEDAPFFPGSTSLVSQLDKRILSTDGRQPDRFHEILKYSNIVWRIRWRHIGGIRKRDIYLGLYVVRGESRVLAEMEDEEEDEDEDEAENENEDVDGVATLSNKKSSL